MFADRIFIYTKLRKIQPPVPIVGVVMMEREILRLAIIPACINTKTSIRGTSTSAPSTI